MKLSADLPVGVTALLFEAARRRRLVEAPLVSRLEAAGYSEVILPVVDYVAPYEAFLTAASRGELYRFLDRDGELLALRADFTPMLARLLAPRLGSLDLPLRLHYRGDVVRYHEERAGRRREFYQLGAELIGAEPAVAEREVLRLFLALLSTAGAGPVQVVLGFAGALDHLLLSGARRAGDAEAARLAAAVARRERAVARAGGVPGAVGAVLAEIVERGVPSDPQALGAEPARRLIALAALRDELAAELPGARLTIDLAEFAQQALDPGLLAQVGDRAYYDGLVFRAYVGARALPVGGGGRYDRLFRGLGAETTAVGFSLGLDRLIEALPREVPKREGERRPEGAAIAAGVALPVGAGS
jgi:ATP phosphoribosyltransferase regulatory subunit